MDNGEPFIEMLPDMEARVEPMMLFVARAETVSHYTLHGHERIRREQPQDCRSSGAKLFDIEALNYVQKTKTMFQRL